MLPSQLLGFAHLIGNSDLDTRKCSNPALWPRLPHPLEEPAQLQQKIIYLICSLVTACPELGGFVYVLREVTVWQEDPHTSILSLLWLTHQASLPHAILGPSCFLLSKRELSLILLDGWCLCRTCIGRFYQKCKFPGSGPKDSNFVVRSPGNLHFY